MRRVLAIAALALALSAGTGPAQETRADNAEIGNTEPSGPLRPIDEAYGAYQRGYYLTALGLALERARNNDAAAQTLIAEIYANGLGVPVSAAKAASWYDLADKNGDANASYALAMMYQNGTGVPQNRAKAARLMEKAANAGLPAAQYNLALLYVEGAYVEPNQQKAAGLMEKAADAGLAEAELDFGLMLIEGTGTAPNPRRGATYLRTAAESGLSDAMVEYATLRYLGRGVEKDIENAAAWYQKAARLGNPVAQNRLAILLAVGEGIDKDPQTAAMWRALARRAGLFDAKTDKLLADLSPEDLARAEARARIWPNALEDKAGGTTPDAGNDITVPNGAVAAPEDETPAPVPAIEMPAIKDIAPMLFEEAPVPAEAIIRPINAE